MADTDIVEFYPIPECPHARKREMFASYGTCGGLNVKPAYLDRYLKKKKKRQKSEESGYMYEQLAVEFQCQSIRGCRNKLFATQPSYPLLPPNPHDNLLVEPCMTDVSENKKKLQSAASLLRENCAKMKKRSTQMKVKDMLSHVQSMAGTSAKKRADVTSDSEDDDDGGNRGLRVTLDEEFSQKIHYLASCSQYLGESAVQKQVINPLYIGGCASFLPCSTYAREDILGTLLLPTGPHLSDIAFCPVSSVGDRLHALSSDCKLSLSGRVYETSAVSVNSEHLAVCRHGNASSIMRLQCENDDTQSVTPSVVRSRDWTADNRPTSVCLSPFIAGECAISTLSGSTYLWNARGDLQLCRQSMFANSYRRCHFGSHPRLLVSSQQSCVCLLDMRSRDGVATDLCRVTDSFLHRDEQIMVTRQHPSLHSSHFIATCSSLLMMDERYPRYPVLMWTHSLPTPPIYIDIACGVVHGSDSIDDVVVIASQDSPAELHCFQFHSNTNCCAAPQACGPPWRVSAPLDCALFAAYGGCGRGSSQVLCPRLQAPLTGIAMIPHHNLTAGGLSIVQMSSYGDVFCQSYGVEHSKQKLSHDKTCSAGLASDDVSLSDDMLASVRQWTDEAELQLSAAVAAGLSRRDVIRSDVRPLFAEIYTNVNDAHGSCPFCNLHSASDSSGTYSVDEAAGTDGVCARCRHSLSASAAVSQLVHHAGCSPGDSAKCTMEMLDMMKTVNFDESLKNIDTSQCSDTESLLLIQSWNDEDITDLLVQRDRELLEKFMRTVAEASADAAVPSDSDSAAGDVSDADDE